MGGNSDRWKQIRTLVGDAAGLVCCAALAFLALFPLSVFVSSNHQGLIPVFAALGVTEFLRQRRPAAPWRVLAVVFYALVTINLALIVWLVATIQPLVPVLALAAGAVAYVLRRRQVRIWVAVLFALGLFTLFFATPSGDVRALTVLALLAFLALAGLGALSRTPAPLFAAAVAVLTGVGWFGATFYYGFDRGDTARVASQAGMRVLVDPATREAPALLARTSIFAAKSCDGQTLMIGHYEDAWTKRLDGTAARDQVYNHRTGDELAYECERQTAWVGSYAPGGLVRLDATLRAQQFYPAPGRAITNLRRYGGLLLAGDDHSTDGLVFDLAARAYRAPLRGVGSRDLVRDERTGRFIGATAFHVRWFDGRTGRVERSWFVPSVQLRLDLDPARGDLYVSSFNNGKLYRVDVATGEVRATRQLGAGLRYLRVLPEQSLLAVGNYVTGELHLVRLPDLQVLATLFAGRRIRALNLAPGDHELTFVSRAGAFAWDWKKALPQ